MTIASKRSGTRRQSSKATTPPRLHPTSVKRSIPRRSPTASTSVAKPSRVMSAGSGSASAPLPRSSIAAHRYSPQKASNCESQIAAVEPTPCTKSNARPLEPQRLAPVVAPSAVGHCNVSIMQLRAFVRRRPGPPREVARSARRPSSSRRAALVRRRTRCRSSWEVRCASQSSVKVTPNPLAMRASGDGKSSRIAWPSISSAVPVRAAAAKTAS